MSKEMSVDDPRAYPYTTKMMGWVPCYCGGFTSEESGEEVDGLIIRPKRGWVWAFKLSMWAWDAVAALYNRDYIGRYTMTYFEDNPLYVEEGEDD